MSSWGRRGRGGYGRSSRDDWYGYPQRQARQEAPADGIRVKKIGATWWGRQWVESLDRISPGYGSRLDRGKTYARTGRVSGLAVKGGVVKAKVTGTEVYSVQMCIAPLRETAWAAAIRAMSAEAVFAAKLLSGAMPERIDDAFRASGTSIFPVKEEDLETTCSCPDYANPCKHIAAVHYVLGEAFDGDPFLLFELRGRTRDAVLGELRRVRAAADGDGDGDGDGAGANAVAGAAAERTVRRRRGAGASVEVAAGPGANAESSPGSGATKRPRRTKGAAKGAGSDEAGRAGAAPVTDAVATPSAGLSAGDGTEDGAIDVRPVPAESWDASLCDLAGIALHFGGSEPAAAILRGLGRPSRWDRTESPAEVLAPVYAAAASFARRCIEPGEDEEGAPPDGA